MAASVICSRVVLQDLKCMMGCLYVYTVFVLPTYRAASQDALEEGARISTKSL